MKEAKEIDPVAGAYYRDVAKQQLTLTEGEETLLLDSYSVLRCNLHDLLLSEELCRSSFFDFFLTLYSQKKSLARLSRDFNSKTRGHNRKISRTIEKALLEIGTVVPSKEVLTELNLSDECYDVMYVTLQKNRGRNLSKVDDVKNRMKNIEDTLVRSTLMAAYRVANRYASAIFGIDKKDAIQEANLGLLEAVKKYDVNYRTKEGKRVKFLTLAYSLADTRVKEWIMRRSRLVRLPRSRLDLIFRILAAYNNLPMEDQNLDNLLDKINEDETKPKLTMLQVSSSIELLQGNCLQLDQPIQSDKNTTGRVKTLGEVIPDLRPNALKQMVRESEREILIKILRNKLSPQEYEIIFLRYLDLNSDKEVRPLEEVGQLVKKKCISREGVKQIETRAFQKLESSIPELRILTSLIGEK